MTPARDPSSPLTDLLLRRLRAGERLSFRDFMDLALYHPRHGYYSQPRAPGRAGDFFTSVSVGPCFGELLARYLAETWRRLGSPSPFVVEEHGAHAGRLAGDILAALRADEPDLLSAIRYRLVERSNHWRGKHEVVERDCPGKTESHADWPETPAHCLLANELLDALPVHRVVWKKGRWREIRLTETPNGLGWGEGDPDPELERALERLPSAPWPEGYETEVSLAALAWLRRAVRQADSLLLIDYGLPAAEYHSLSRARGTLRCYGGHRLLEDPLALPGEHDITAHVNFTRLMEEAEALGFRATLEDQHRFLSRLAMPKLLAMERAGEKPDPSWLRQFHQLTHPAALGRAFQVMALRSGWTEDRGLPFSASRRHGSDLGVP